MNRPDWRPLLKKAAWLGGAFAVYAVFMSAWTIVGLFSQISVAGQDRVKLVKDFGQYLEKKEARSLARPTGRSPAAIAKILSGPPRPFGAAQLPQRDDWTAQYLARPELEGALGKARRDLGADAPPTLLALFVANRLTIEPTSLDEKASQRALGELKRSPRQGLQELLYAARRLHSLDGMDAEKQLLFEAAAGVLDAPGAKNPENEQLLAEIGKLTLKNVPQ